jgi:hypothetical protein
MSKALYCTSQNFKGKQLPVSCFSQLLCKQFRHGLHFKKTAVFFISPFVFRLNAKRPETQQELLKRISSFLFNILAFLYYFLLPGSIDKRGVPGRQAASGKGR